MISPPPVDGGPPLSSIPIPAGYAPGQTLVPLIWGITLSFCILATVLAGLRIYVRHVLLHVMGLDDWLLLLALIFGWVNGVVGLWATGIGFGRHLYDIIKEGNDPSPLRYLGFLGPMFYNLSQALIQLSILTFYLRLSFTRRLEYMTYALMVFSVLNTSSATIVSTVFTFVHAGEDDSWKNPRTLWYTNSSLSLVIDLAIWCLPLPTLWKLKNLHFRKRLALIATFSVGLLSCLSLVVRLSFVDKAASNRGDEPWGRVMIHLMCLIEATLGVCCASMATFRPLCQRWGCFSLGDSAIGVSKRPYQEGYRSQGNTATGHRKSQSNLTGKHGSIYLGPNGRRGAISCTVTGTGWSEDGYDEVEIEGQEEPNPPNQTGEVQEGAGDIELASIDNPRKTPQSNPFSGILRTCTIETRRERIDGNGNLVLQRQSDRGRINGGSTEEFRSESTLSLTVVESGSCIGANEGGRNTTGAVSVSSSLSHP